MRPCSWCEERTRRESLTNTSSPIMNSTRSKAHTFPCCEVCAVLPLKGPWQALNG